LIRKRPRIGIIPRVTLGTAAAGRLVQWIDETGGRAVLRTLYGRLRADATVEANAKVFQEVVGLSVAEVDEKLRKEAGLPW